MSSFACLSCFALRVSFLIGGLSTSFIATWTLRLHLFYRISLIKPSLKLIFVKPSGKSRPANAALFILPLFLRVWVTANVPAELSVKSILGGLPAASYLRFGFAHYFLLRIDRPWFYMTILRCTLHTCSSPSGAFRMLTDHSRLEWVGSHTISLKAQSSWLKFFRCLVKNEVQMKSRCRQ